MSDIFGSYTVAPMELHWLLKLDPSLSNEIKVEAYRLFGALITNKMTKEEYLSDMVALVGHARLCKYARDVVAIEICRALKEEVIAPPTAEDLRSFVEAEFLPRVP